MKSHTIRRHLLSIILTILLGSLSHFLYEWSGESPFIALISPINESTWEHLKLLFFPFLALTTLEYLLTRPTHYSYCESFFTARYVGVLSGMVAIVVLFYLYTGIIGTPLLAVDILLFVISVLVAYTISDYICDHQLVVANSLVVFLAWFLTLLFFFIFTAYPLELFLFFPPLQ